VLAQETPLPTFASNSMAKGISSITRVFSLFLDTAVSPGHVCLCHHSEGNRMGVRIFQSAASETKSLAIQYDAAFMVRHDLENFTNEVAAIEASHRSNTRMVPKVIIISARALCGMMHPIQIRSSRAAPGSYQLWRHHQPA